MADKRRGYRVAEQIQILVAKELHRVSDPRLHLVTVTRCEISPDLKHAKIFWLIHGDEEKRTDATEAFEETTGIFRKYLASSLGVRAVPHIKFLYDTSLDDADRMEQLFSKIRSVDKKDYITNQEKTAMKSSSIKPEED